MSVIHMYSKLWSTNFPLSFKNAVEIVHILIIIQVQM